MPLVVREKPNQLRIMNCYRAEGDELVRPHFDINFYVHKDGQMTLRTGNSLRSGIVCIVSKEAAKHIIEWLSERLEEMKDED